MITNNINASSINPQSSSTLPGTQITQKTSSLPSAEPQQKPGSEPEIKQAIQQIEKVVNNLAQNLLISIDEDTGKTIVKILDGETQKVIRQFPTEEAIAIARSIDKVQGLLFNDKA